MITDFDFSTLPLPPNAEWTFSPTTISIQARNHFGKKPEWYYAVLSKRSDKNGIDLNNSFHYWVWPINEEHTIVEQDIIGTTEDAIRSMYTMVVMMGALE